MVRPTRRRRSAENWALAVLLACHVALGLYYSTAIPIWEAFDEIGHYYYVRHLATTHTLPEPDRQLVAENDESAQPPLYYVLAALPVSLVREDDGVQPKANPYMFWGPQQGGFNRVVHDASAEGWPYRGTVLGVHLARGVSVLLGAVALIATFAAARLLFPVQPWVRWGAALVLLFWPHLRLSTAVITNDIMVTACAAVALWLAVRVLVVRPARVLDVLGLGAAAGAALLSKINGLALLPVVLAALLGGLIAAAPSDRRRVAALLAGGIVLGSAVVGVWLFRNVSHGTGALGSQGRNVSALSRLVADTLFDTGRGRLALVALWRGLPSLWASFGWGNISLPAPLYWAAAAWSLGGALGLVCWCLGRPTRREVAGVVLAAFVVTCVTCIGLLYTAGGGQASLPGRYLLPAVPALSILLSLGWCTVLPSRLRTLGWAALATVLCLQVALIPSRLIQPAYAVPPQLPEAQLAAYTPVHYSFGGFADLLGYRMKDRFIAPGGVVHLDLVWQAVARAEVDYTLAAQAFEGDRTLVGEVHRFPGHGTLATTTWKPGHLFVESIDIPIRSQDARAHTAWVELGFYNRNDLSSTVVEDASGRQLGASVRLSRIKVRGTASSAGARTAEGLQFGPAIRLIGVVAATAASPAGGHLALDLDWQAVGRPDADYTVSLQLRDDRQNIVTQVDAQPQAGEYPTSLWEPGDDVRDHCILNLPADMRAGAYNLYVCLYDLATSARLPAVGPEGQALPAREAMLLSLTVSGDRTMRITPASSLVRS